MDFIKEGLPGSSRPSQGGSNERGKKRFFFQKKRTLVTGREISAIEDTPDGKKDTLVWGSGRREGGGQGKKKAKNQYSSLG